jgi:glycosyltransferase involved in cell wall biosynthesis
VSRPRLHVAVVTPRFVPEPGGVEQYSAWVAGVLRDAGHRVTVITTGRSRRASRASHDGIDVIRLGTWLTVSNTPLNPLWAWQLRGLLRRLAVDVVNAHAPVPGLADLAVWTSAVPVVLTYHAGSLVKGGHWSDGLLRWYERHVLPRVFRRSASLVAVSPVSLAHGVDHAEVVPPGVDCSLFAPAADPGREPRILYVGRVESSSRWKGLGVLLEALRVVADSVPSARLDVVGDGDDLARLRRRAAELGIADRVEWRGRVPHDRLPAFYQRAAVTVLPSLTEAESFGMCLVEAMACGCPVVGSAVGGIPFVIRDGHDGLLVDPGDPRALAAALVTVLSDGDAARRLGAAGRSSALQRWDWRLQQEQTLRIVEGAVA